MASDPNIKQSEAFDAADADLVLRSAPDASGIVTDFKVHKRMLDGLSLVFNDMFSLGDQHAAGAAGLPVVQLEEKAQALSTLLPFLQDDLDKMDDMDTLTHSRLLQLWDTATKYQIPVIQMLAETAMRGRLARCDAPFALEILARGSRYGRTSLATPARVRLLELDPATFPQSLLLACQPTALASLFSDVAQSYGKLLSTRAVLAAVKRDRAMLCEKIVQA